MNLTVWLPCGPGSIPGHGKGFFRDFPLADHTLPTRSSQRGRKWLNLPSMAPHNPRISRRKAEIQPWTDDGENKS